MPESLISTPNKFDNRRSSPDPRPPTPVLSTLHLLPSTLFSLLLTPLFALSTLRRNVIRRNFDLIPIPKPLFFRWKLGFHLLRDVFSLLFGRIPRPRLSLRSRIRLEGLRRGPSMLLAAHFHNWEAQAAALSRLGVPLLGAGRPLAAPWADRLLRSLRARRGIAVVTDDVPRRALRHLRSGGCFGFLWDQHSPAGSVPSLAAASVTTSSAPASGDPAPGRFFGHPVSLNPLPTALLAHEPCPAYFGVWLPGGELRLLVLLRGVPGDFRGDWQNRLQRRYHRVLELLVRRHPPYWYGFLHARFKNLGPYPGHRKGG